MLSAALLCILGAQAQAQHTDTTTAEVPRYEIGGLVYNLGGGNHSDLADAGFGGRFTYNLTKYLAVDTELSASVDFDDDYFVVNGAQGFAGLKAGGRYKRVGVFAKARPGFVTNFHRARPGGASPFDAERIAKPAFDLGGVFEIYLSRNAAIRFDASDVIIPFGGDVIEEVRCPCPRRLGTTHSFASSIGLTVRF
jgi:hypothetical protein